MTLQLQKVQYTYGNTTAKSTIHACQYNRKKVQYKYDNITAKSTIDV